MKLGHIRRKPGRTSDEAGYLLIVIMLMVAVLAIASLARVQSLVTELKRDQEEELIHRGVQYARAVKKYYKKTGSYPATLDQLDKTNNMRFLRKRYKDPITGKDFHLVRYSELLLGQNSQSGLFPGNNANNAGGIPGSSGNLNPAAAQTILNATGFGGGPGVSASGNNATAQPTTASSGQGSSGQANSDNGGTTSNPGGTASDKSSGSGQTFGGGPFVGVASTSPKVSLKEFDKKNHYKEWMFVYVPQMDLASANGTPRLINGPFLQSQMTGGIGGQNQPILQNSAGQSSQTPSQSPQTPIQNQGPTQQNSQPQSF